MSKTENRRREILEILAREGKVRIAPLSQSLGVSLVTVRGDLKSLQEQGLLNCITGGAIQSRADAGRALLVCEKQIASAAKLNIARKAAMQVCDGETLMINSGTTTRLFALELKRLSNLKIVTNSVIIAQELSGFPNINLTLLGGKVNPQFFFTYGADAAAQLRKYKADKSILSVDGISVSTGISTYHEEEAAINAIMMERAFKTLIVADATKLGKESFAKFSDIGKIDMLITSPGEKEKAEAIQSRGVTVCVCE